MERLEDSQLESRRVLNIEHRHRYIWASELARGTVCDIACGDGYGSQIFTDNKNVNTYFGFDASVEATQKANRNFSGLQRSFACAEATAIPLMRNSVDTVVSLETLEHVLDPTTALQEFRRIMKPGAILAGSVPSKHFEERCEEVYGPNEYHLQRFSFEELIDLLRRFFPVVRFQYSALEIVSHIGQLSDGRPKVVESTIWNDSLSNSSDRVHGSFHFVASDHEIRDSQVSQCNRVQLCQGFTEFEAIHIVPLRRAFKDAEHLILQKDQHLAVAAELLRQKDELLHEKDELVRQKDERSAELLRRDNNPLYLTKRLFVVCFRQLFRNHTK